MLLRRARPTLRLLREDLITDWVDPAPRRALTEGNVEALHPLSGLPHPIVLKASDCFGDDPTQDHHAGAISSSRTLTLLEIKAGQWRGGVWIDEKGVCWLVAAGLAKGDHQDWNDFYQQIVRREQQGELGELRPSSEDVRLWKREVASWALSQWEQSLQAAILGELEAIHAGGTAALKVRHPLEDTMEESDVFVAEVAIQIEPVRDDDYQADDVVVTVTPSARWIGSALAWTVTTRVLISLSPPEQGWDRFGDTFSNIAEPGAFTQRRDELDEICAVGKLAESVPGTHAHRTHNRDLTERTVCGQAVRALCGAFFVPRQDHQELPECENCRRRLEEIVASVE